MDRKAAKNLLDATIHFVTAAEDLAAEGNSGEFYNRKEAEKLNNKLSEAEQKFQKAFYAATGYYAIKRINDKIGETKWLISVNNRLVS